jgi:protein-tyrosine-phosphatase
MNATVINNHRKKNRMKRSVLFICTYNSVRSQMAEGLLRHHAGSRYDVFSAGIYPGEFVDPGVCAVLAEKGISTEELTPKTIGSVSDASYDSVVIVCSASSLVSSGYLQAHEVICREFSVPDITGPDGLVGFRRLRDEMSAWICEELCR